MLPLTAHHSARAEFDDSKIVTMTILVREVTWMNPHATISGNVVSGGLTGAEWTIETPPPNALKRLGWQKTDLKPGDRVTMGVWVARNGETRAMLRNITLPDGRTLASLPAGWDNVPLLH